MKTVVVATFAALMLTGSQLAATTSAQAAAAFGKLITAGTIAPEETTVVVLTGTGLKDTRRYAELLGIAI